MIPDRWHVVDDKAGWVHQTAKGWRVVFWEKQVKAQSVRLGKSPMNNDGNSGGAYMLGTYNTPEDAEKMFVLLATAGAERLCSTADIDKVRGELSRSKP